MKLSAILAPLIAAKVPHDVIMQTVQAWESEQSDALEKRREADRVRQDRKRQSDKSRDVTLRHSDSHLVRDRDAPVDVKQITNRTTKEERKDKSADKPLSDLHAFKAEISPILDEQRIDAICAIRRKKRAVFSAHAGSLLSKALQSCPDVLVAADAMILRNWTSVEPDWLENRSSRQQQAPPPQRTIFDAIDDFTGKNGHEFSAETTIDHDGGDHPPNVHLIAAAKRR